MTADYLTMVGRAMLDHPHDGLIVVRLVHDEGGRPSDFETMWFNAAAEHIEGLSLKSGQHLIKDHPPLGGEIFDLYLQAMRQQGQWLITEQPARLSGDLDPSPWYWLGLRSLDHEHLLIHLRDITVLQELREQMSYQSSFDALTGLWTRQRLEEHLDAEMVRLQESGPMFAVLFCDVDNFKWVNDRFGHAAGDQLLQELARRLRFAMRQQDFVARFGGDEFIIVLSELGRDEDLKAIVSRLLEKVSGPVQLDAASTHLGISVGVAPVHQPISPSRAIAEADSALYQAKREGRGRFRFFNAALQEQASQRRTIEDELRQGLEREEFVAHYQPKVSLKTRQIVGAESLVRWRHPRRGMLHPAQFIDVADESFLMVGIGTTMLKQATHDAQEWTARTGQHLSVSVNLCARHLSDPQLAFSIDDILRESGLDPQQLVVEVTETQVFADIKQARMNLEQLSAQGISISLDDFGTGHSSLSWLQQLPVSEIKVDQSFIRDLQHSEQNRQIVHSVISLGHALGATVVAEGIEEEAQLAILTDMGCDTGQGFLLGVPQTTDDIEALLRSGRWGQPLQ